MLFELVYSSAAYPHGATQDALHDILAKSREKNARLDITGVLLFENDEFVQLLEGPRQAVCDLYYKAIAGDDRHHPHVCWEFEIEARNFPDWTMGFARAADLADARSPALPGYLERGVAGLDLGAPGSTGRELLLEIYRMMQER